MTFRGESVLTSGARIHNMSPFDVYAPVVKLAYTQRSGRCARKGVEVRLLSGAPIL
jgi:hypothetical protein